MSDLRALAENAADPDGWWPTVDFLHDDDNVFRYLDHARFVAAASPAVVLALLDRLEAAEAAVEAARRVFRYVDFGRMRKGGDEAYRAYLDADRTAHAHRVAALARLEEAK